LKCDDEQDDIINADNAKVFINNHCPNCLWLCVPTYQYLPFLHFNQSTNRRQSKPANKFDPSKTPQDTQLEHLNPNLVSVTAILLCPLPSHLACYHPPTNFVHRSNEHLW
jgi:hypothetical protein